MSLVVYGLFSSHMGYEREHKAYPHLSTLCFLFGLKLPPEYPFKPPHIIFLTPSGRFETNTKICLSFSAFHPELWQPAWGIRLILEALISFLPTPADGAIGALDWSKEERRRLAKLSQNYHCPICGHCADLLPKLDQDSKKKSSGGIRFAKEIAELQRLQQVAEKKKPVIEEGKETEQRSKQDETESNGEVKNETIKEAICQQEDVPKEEILSDKEPIDESTNETTQDPVSTEKTPTIEETNVQSPNTTGDTEEDAIPNVDALRAAVPMDDPSWMYDPLLNLMIILMAAICYLLIQKYQELMEELEEVRALSRHAT